MGAPMDILTFEQQIRLGIQNYKENKKVLAFLTLHQAWGDNTNLMVRFKELNRRVASFVPRYTSPIDYIGVLVMEIDKEKNQNRFHFHMFWKKPWIKIDVLRHMWQHISQDNTAQVSVNTVTYTKTSIERVVRYALGQAVEHMPCEVKYLRSETWGYVKKKLSKKELLELQTHGQKEISGQFTFDPKKDLPKVKAKKQLDSLKRYKNKARRASYRDDAPFLKKEEYQEQKSSIETEKEFPEKYDSVESG